MIHSTIVGGSTAKRVIACPASINLVAKMPPKPSSKYADEGTLLHDAISQILDCKATPASVIGMVYEGITLTQELYDDKMPALGTAAFPGKWCSNALSKVPLQFPGAGCTTRPAGLFTTKRCSSLYTTSKVIGSGLKA